MEKEFSSFRKATFGGFNRKDVINYIEKMRNESYEYKKQVDETIKSLNEKIRELENAARLMENITAEGYSAACEEVKAESFGDIGNATKHLKVVADELCKSLGDFMDKLSEKGLFDKVQDAGSEKEKIEITDETEPMSFVDGILASISYLGFTKEEKEASVNKEEKAESVSIGDILSGYSFLK